MIQKEAEFDTGEREVRQRKEKSQKNARTEKGRKKAEGDMRQQTAGNRRKTTSKRR